MKDEQNKELQYKIINCNTCLHLSPLLSENDKFYGFGKALANLP